MKFELNEVDKIIITILKIIVIILKNEVMFWWKIVGTIKHSIKYMLKMVQQISYYYRNIYHIPPSYVSIVENALLDGSKLIHRETQLGEEIMALAFAIHFNGLIHVTLSLGKQVTDVKYYSL